MRRGLAITAATTVLVSAGVAGATAPPDTSPAPADSAGTTVAEGSMVTATTMASGEATTPADTSETGESAPATIYDEPGDPVATVTVTGVDTAWADYEEGKEPDEGHEYVQVIVDVASAVTEGTFGIAAGDFILQDQNGFVTSAETVRSAAQAESDEEIVDEADLANGESIELTLTFQVDANAGPQSVFYRPDDDRLVDITEIG
jgi:hypothetical protein